jgi:hypothetical protein
MLILPLPAIQCNDAEGGLTRTSPEPVHFSVHNLDHLLPAIEFRRCKSTPNAFQSLVPAKLKMQTLFGMHLFDKETPSQNQAAFYISIILISVTTYFVSGFTLWRVTPDDGKAQLIALFQAIAEKFRRKGELPDNSQEKV